MPSILRKNGSTSNIIRTRVRNSTTGQGFTGLTSSSTGLVISTICDNEASPTVYTAAGSTIESITTLGTFATPTATKCRLKLVDDTNDPGLIEIQLDNARFAVSSAKSLTIFISGVTNLLGKEIKVQLTAADVDDATALGLSMVPTNVKQINAVATSSVTTVNANIGTTQAITFDANNLPKVDIEDIAGAAVNINAAQLGVKTVSTAANAITNSSLAANAITSSNVAASFFLQFMVRYASTAQAGGASTITLDSGASATDHLYEGEEIVITGGTGAGQTRVITGYVGSTKVATVDTAWTTAPDNTSTFNILSRRNAKLDSNLQVTAASVQGNVTGSVGSVTGSVGSVTGAVGSVTGNVGGNVVGSVGSVVSGVTLAASQHVIVDSGTITTLTNLPSIPNGWLTAAGIAANALNGKGDWMVTYTQPTGFLAATFPTTVASTTNITAGTITTVTNLTNAPTAGDFTATMKTSLNAATPTATIAGADGLTFTSLQELLIAFIAGKATYVDNGDGTATLTFKKQDGTTTKYTVTFNTTTGARTASTIS